MNGTVLYDGKRSTTETCAVSRAASTHLASTEAQHSLHGLVAIANGPDYCLCGRTWPCEERGA